MTPASNISSCLIVGAGMAGLAAGRMLVEAGIRVTVVEKARGVGGRVATRRVDDAVFDYGAQFCTVSDDRFAALMDRWCARGAAREWARGFHPRPEQADAHRPCYCGTHGMTSLAKELAAPLDVRVNARVVALEAAGAAWRVSAEGGGTFEADAVLLTPPVPQTLDLLDASRLRVPPDLQPRLEGIEYERCIAVLVQLEGPSGIPPPGGVKLDTEPIQWLADNYVKGVSPRESSVTIHAGPEFSRAYWHEDDAHLVKVLLDAAGGYVPAPVRSSQVHRWRYSKPAPCLEERVALAVGSPPLLLAGDAFGGTKVEGAVLSGWAAAGRLLGGGEHV